LSSILTNVCFLQLIIPKEGKATQREVIREILMKVKQDDGGFDFSRFKVLYSNHYINDEL
jgi:hypothetical protein